MDASARQQMIIEMLAERQAISIGEVHERAGVSEMTVRRDFEVLEKQGVLKRVHGGATAATSLSYEPNFVVRSRLNVKPKSKIAEAAARMVSEGDTVVLDAGTTTLMIAEQLKDRSNITVCTPSLRIANVLADEPNLRLMLSGGIVRHGEGSLIGEEAQLTFARHHFDIAFMSASGLHSDSGLTEWNVDDAPIKKAIIASAARVVVVADASKMGQQAFVHLCEFDQIETLVTDRTSDAHLGDGKLCAHTHGDSCDRPVAPLGVDRIAATCRMLTDAVAGQAVGYRTAPTELRSPHLIGLRLPGGLEAGEVAKRLQGEAVHVSVSRRRDSGVAKRLQRWSRC